MIWESIHGESVPVLGFGTWHLRGEEGHDAIRYAIDTGYRHIDTAARYENEEEVGRAVAGSGLPRSEFFIATKLRYRELDPDQIEARILESLDRLGMSYVDLLMPHWPSPDFSVRDVMQALREVQRRGYARHIGLSNFPVALLREALAAFGAPLFGNQVEYHPFLDQTAVLTELRARDMLLTACVPLARGAVDSEPVLQEIARAHGKTPGQVALRWLIQQPRVIAIPKSGRRERIRANFEIFDFTLTAEEMIRIGSLRGGMRVVDPDWAPVVWDPPAETPAPVI